jgi:hypothetical protein
MFTPLVEHFAPAMRFRGAGDSRDALAFGVQATREALRSKNKAWLIVAFTVSTL